MTLGSRVSRLERQHAGAAFGTGPVLRAELDELADLSDAEIAVRYELALDAAPPDPAFEARLAGMDAEAALREYRELLRGR